jgi:two-component system, NarL family, invasion response regulator UvrY
MKKAIRILIVDDHDLVRTGIRHMLDSEPSCEVIGEAGSGEDAIELGRSLLPDVILMDIKMPGIGGLEATRRLIRSVPDVKILIVTVCTDNLFPSKLLQAGAFGYLTKGASLKEMIRAIKSIYSGQRYISPEIASKLAIMHLTEHGESPFEQLSERELQVTMMIIKGMKPALISEKLHLSPKTINSYRYRIFEKLNIKNDVELTHLAIRHNLLEEIQDS